MDGVLAVGFVIIISLYEEPRGQKADEQEVAERPHALRSSEGRVE